MNRFGQIILANRWIVVGLLVAFTILFSCYLPNLRLGDDLDTWLSENDQTLALYERFRDQFPSHEYLLVAYPSRGPVKEQELVYLSQLTKRLEKIPHVSEAISLTSVLDIRGGEEGLTVAPLIGDPLGKEKTIPGILERIESNPFIYGTLISEDKTTIGIVLRIGLGGDTSAREASRATVSALKAMLAQEERSTGRKFYSGGASLVEEELDGMMVKDLATFGPLAILLCALISLGMFRSLTAVLLPQIAVGLSLVWTFGLKGLLGSPITPVSSTLVALVMVIGIAASIHLLTHYRLELPRRRNQRDALLATFERAGWPCFFTSVTTAIGFGSLCVSSMPAIRDLGFLAAFGILCAFVHSMIIIPLGLEWTKGKLPVQDESRPDFLVRFLKWVGERNLKYANLILVVSALIAFVMGVGITRIQAKGEFLEYFRENSSVAQSASFLDEKLGGSSNIEVVVYGEEGDMKNPLLLQGIDGLQRMVASRAEVTRAFSVVDYVKLINRALHDDDPGFFSIPESREGIAQSLFLYELAGGDHLSEYIYGDYEAARISIRTKQMDEGERQDVLRAIEHYLNDHLPDAEWVITGFDALFSHINESIVLTQIQSLGLAFLVILALMIVLFGIRGGIASILPNAFPIIFILGLMGYACFPLTAATAIITAIAIGLVVDDTIHYFFHFRYEFSRSGNRELAMKGALEGVGQALCWTTILLALGFFIFLFSEVSILSDFGILAGISILVALLGDLFLGSVILYKYNVFAKPSRSVPS